MSKYQSVLIATFVFLVTAIAAPRAEERMLKGDELKALLSGATMSGLNSRGHEWQAKFSAGGTYTLEVPSKNWSDNGTWDVEGDKY